MKKIKLKISKDLFLLHLIRDSRGDDKIEGVVRAIMGEIKCNKRKSFTTEAKKE